MNAEQNLKRSDYKVGPVIFAAGKGFLVGGYSEYIHQRKELKESVDSTLPLWKQELEIIKATDKRQIIKIAMLTATLEAGREVCKQTADAIRHPKQNKIDPQASFIGGYSYSFA